MTIAKKKILTQTAKLVIVLMLLTLGIIYPFMYGEYDSLAMPLSILIQGFGIIGLLLSVFAAFMLLIPQRRRLFANSIVYLCAFLATVLAFFAYLTAGLLFGMIILAICTLVFIRIQKSIKELTDKEHFLFIPIYLIIIPIYILSIQLLIVKSITNCSRDRSIANAYEYIRDIENFKSKNGYYPKTLQAMYADYAPKTVGVEKYHYLPFADTYNVSFEQPRFLFDEIGTKEWVVYNPKDEHRVYSHTSWFLLLSPEESEIRPGWYASENTKHKHWKSFLFD